MIYTRFVLASAFTISPIGFCAGAQMWQPSSGHLQLSIWPGSVPDAVPVMAPETVSLTGGGDLVAGEPYIWITNVSQPTITVYSPEKRNTGAALVVFPGGGYKGLAIDLEGTEVCEWLVSKGITCIVLKYRVPDSGPRYSKDCNCQKSPVAPTALQDAQRAMGLVRFNAKSWHIDPHRIGVLGFSAGGHLVADVSTHWGKRAYRGVDDADKESCRPDFAIALYPGHMLKHSTQKLELNPTIPVSAETPPTFLLQAVDDPVDRIENSLAYYVALKKVGVAVEIHQYKKGGHAFGLRPTALPITHWPALVEVWLTKIGVLKQ